MKQIGAVEIGVKVTGPRKAVRAMRRIERWQRRAWFREWRLMVKVQRVADHYGIPGPIKNATHPEGYEFGCMCKECLMESYRRAQ